LQEDLFGNATDHMRKDNMFLYSYEIAQLLESKGYNIDSETYIDMMNSSPQINHITYKPFDDCFDMWSVDGEYWNYKVYKK
jgi:hypothetical protein